MTLEIITIGLAAVALVGAIFWGALTSSKRDRGKAERAEVQREHAIHIAEELAAFQRGERRFRDLSRAAKLAELRARAMGPRP